MKAQERATAFALILKGYSIRETAALVGVSRSSVERWSAREGWARQRIEFRRKAIEETKRNLISTRVTSLNLMSDRLFKMFDHEYAGWVAYREGKLRKPRASMLAIARLAEIAVKVGDAEIDLLDTKISLTKTSNLA